MRWAEGSFGISQRRACGVLCAPRATVRYRGQRDDQAGLQMRIREIAQTRIAYGYRRITVLVQREGWRVNHKRVQRLYRLDKLGQVLRPETENPEMREPRQIPRDSAGVSGKAQITRNPRLSPWVFYGLTKRDECQAILFFLASRHTCKSLKNIDLRAMVGDRPQAVHGAFQHREAAPGHGESSPGEKSRPAHRCAEIRRWFKPSDIRCVTRCGGVIKHDYRVAA